jgi:hypothetical protein
MSSRSTRKAAASVIDVADQQTANDPPPAATDAPAERDALSDTTLAAIPAEPRVSDEPAAEVIDTAPAIEAEPVAAIAPEPTAEPEPNVTGDVLRQQLEQLVQSVSIVEELSRRARETAAGDLALYQALLASQQQYAERLDQACAIRDQAHSVLEHAFGQAARAAAEPLVAEAERVLQAFTQLAVAWQQRASDFLVEHPDVELLLAERRAQEEQARRQETLAARAHRLKLVVASSEEALDQGLLAEGRRLLAALEHEFPGETATIHRLRLKLEQCVRAARDAAAHQALALATEHQARGDLEAAVSVLEQVEVHGLSEEMSQDVFGRWSDTCSRLAQTAGAVLVRFAPAQGRGLILYTDPAYPNGLVVFSSLGMGPGFPQGKVVTDIAVLRRARPFREASPLPVTAWTSTGYSASVPAPAVPIRH